MAFATLRAVLSDRIEESPANQRLGNDVVKAGFSRALCQHGIVKPRDHDRLACPTILAEILQDGEAIDVGHPIVEDHAVRVL